jgi:hypothetical protein
MHNAEKVEKHRFLVQSKVVDDDDFQRIKVLPSAEKTDELSKLWDGPKDDKRNIKLKVEFKYPENLSNSPHRPATNASENSEAIRNKLKSEPIPISSSPEVIFSELQNLRKKYDAVVDYTVHLTAERDSIVNQLDAVQRELNKERSKKGKENSGSSKSEKNEKRVVERVSSNLASLLFGCYFSSFSCFFPLLRDSPYLWSF